MAIKTILVTGATGQVGQEFQVLEAAYPQYRFLFAGLFELDITNTQHVVDFFRKRKIDFCINCAAYTAVDQAEREPEEAYRVNVEGVKHLAQSCLTRDIPLIHLSTDYVYHGPGGRPFRESDPTSPQGVYARTKLEGEQIALQIHPLTTVIRTSWVYSSFGHNFVKTMLRLAGERDSVRVVDDQTGTPTFAHDLAGAIMTMLEQVDSGAVPSVLLRGIYHYSNEGTTSWCDFAKAIFELKGLPTEVVPIATNDFPTPAKRPPYSVLDKSKIKSAFHLSIPAWRDSLAACLRLLP
jgi:dTDP-4-dehydrorhamnose reductase